MAHRDLGMGWCRLAELGGEDVWVSIFDGPPSVEGAVVPRGGVMGDDEEDTVSIRTAIPEEVVLFVWTPRCAHDLTRDVNVGYP